LRLDHYRLYGLQLSRQAIDSRMECVPDWSPTCSLSWSRSTKSEKRRHRPRAHPPNRRPRDLPPPLSPEPA
jgi:hypothetical protein